MYGEKNKNKKTPVHLLIDGRAKFLPKPPEV
jgi:hypothetical protein